MRTLILLLALIIVSCQDKGKKEVDSKFSKILREMQDELDRLGQWDYSPDGMDSVWVQGSSHDPVLMDSVLTDFQTVQTKWDSLLFLSKKYDSVPYPSQEVLGYHMAKLKRIESLIKLKAALDRAIEAGVYDKNGREIKK